MQLNVSSDVVYEDEFANLSLTNIGMFESIEDDISNDDKVTALQKLYALDDDNLQESNKKYVLTKYLENDIDELKTNPSYVTQLNSIAHQHPFYGGEAVYFARAIFNSGYRGSASIIKKKEKR